MSTTTAHTIADKVNPTPPPSRDLSYLVSAWDRDHQLLQAPARVRARRNRLSALVAPHASVLRVARLVTLRASPSEVFAAVADEIARCLTEDNASVCRFEGDEVVVLALSHLEPGMNNKPVVGEHHVERRQHRNEGHAHRPPGTTGQLRVEDRSRLHRRTPA